MLNDFQKSCRNHLYFASYAEKRFFERALFCTQALFLIVGIAEKNVDVLYFFTTISTIFWRIQIS